MDYFTEKISRDTNKTFFTKLFSIAEKVEEELCMLGEDFQSKIF